MTRKEFLFTTILIIVTIVMFVFISSLGSQTKKEVLITSDMQLYRTHFKLSPEGKIIEIFLFFYKDNKFYRVLVYGSNTLFKGYMYIKNSQLFFKDRYGKIWKYNPKKSQQIFKMSRRL